MKNILFLAIAFTLLFTVHGAAQSDIYGVVERPTGVPICEVLISLYDANGQLVDEDLSNEDGSFTFEDVEDGEGYYFTFDREDAELNGTSTFDLVIMVYGILGITPLDQYQQWVSDVNGTGTTTTLDLVFLRKLILGITEDLPIDDLWLFGFPDATEGSTTLQLDPVTQDVDMIIIGMKMGDVNSSSAIICE